MSESGRSQPLSPADLPLHGRHLIEASAGTGKTYNITRLYLRLLIEKQLSVQQILVMTFTKAATEELRGRIEAVLRESYDQWDALVSTDPFFQKLAQKVDKAEALATMHRALLELDEAAIFTIHGFCNRILSQEAFASGLPMDISMEADTSELLLESVRDWLRRINQQADKFDLLEANNWHTPHQILQEFGALLRHDEPLQVVSRESVLAENPDAFQDLVPRKQRLLTLLSAMEAEITAGFIEKTKGQEQARGEAWAALKSWLGDPEESACPKVARLCVNWTKMRAPLRAHFEPVRTLIENTDEWLDKTERIPALLLLHEGILAIRDGFKRLKKQHMVMDFDDLISHLSQRLNAADGAQLVRIIRNQYPVALVDEFQDTDPHQYAILNQVYPRSAEDQALFMIGDPKQAIYGFRGGDIFAYLQARSEADYQWHMDTNWRSIDEVVTGYNRIFWGAPLTDPATDVFGYDIHYEQIHHTVHAKAAKMPMQDDLSLNGSDRGDGTDDRRCALHFFWLAEIDNPSGKSGKPLTADWQNGLAAWCVAEVERLLANARLGETSLRESDIAILVRSGAEAAIVKNWMQRADLPSVFLSDRSNVYSSPQAEELRWVLQGILECENDTLLVTALSTRLMGGNAERLARYQQADGEALWERTRDRVMQLRELWIKRGCMSMLLELIHHHYLPEPEQHERALTNMLHLAEKLQEASRKYRQPQQLFKWYRDQCLNPDATEEAQLRLESDANLIRIVTMHSSKGLEYPIVFVPFASNYADPARSKSVSKYHDPKDLSLRYQIGADDTAVQCMVNEAHAESVRLLYVAITRASHRCYLGAAPFPRSERSALGLTLSLADVGQWLPALQALAETSEGCIGYSQISSALSNGAPVSPNRSEAPMHMELSASDLQHPIDDSWRLASYSALARQVFTERQDRKNRDEEDRLRMVTDEVPNATAGNNPAVPDLLPLRFRLTKGRQAGNLLHDILERIDFSHPHWDEVIDRPLQRFDQDGWETLKPELVAWLEDCLDTRIPLVGESGSTFTLGQLTHAHTLREAEFYFPLTQVRRPDLISILKQHRQQFAQVSGGLFLPGESRITGMMHGFIDLIFEVEGRYFVCDYKSTHLGDDFSCYGHGALLENIQAHFYDLQYLIYCAALDRYLAARLGPQYNREQHFGGVYYFFLRGMSAANPLPMGIFAQSIEPAFLEALNRVMGELPEEAV
ncbi:MAG: exodeoxyribonuclease V subunit beta [Pseudomonadales bacterium]|nr:exodeoxyribonuclease V subunit beta [Pseudomonadales bacterium]